MNKIYENLWEDSLEKLKIGNKKYCNGTSIGNVSENIRKETFENGQFPFAVVISCSDSRVIPESIFSASIGDLFIIRVVGNVVDSTVTASMEYAIGHLNVPLVLVLGHTACGAITAAINGNATGRIKETIDKISSVIGDEKDDYKASVINVNANVKAVQNAIANDYPQVKVIGAIYLADSGIVEFID